MSKVKKLPLVISMLSIISSSYSIFNIPTLAMDSKSTINSNKDTYKNCPFTPEKLFNDICKDFPLRNWKTKLQNNSLSLNDKERIMLIAKNYLRSIHISDFACLNPVEIPSNVDLNEAIDHIILNFGRAKNGYEAYTDKHYSRIYEIEQFDSVSETLVLYRLAKYIEAPFVIHFYVPFGWEDRKCKYKMEIVTSNWELRNRYLKESDLFLLLPNNEKKACWSSSMVVKMYPKKTTLDVTKPQDKDWLCASYFNFYEASKDDQNNKSVDFPDFFNKKIRRIDSDYISKYFSCEKLNQLLFPDSKH